MSLTDSVNVSGGDEVFTVTLSSEMVRILQQHRDNFNCASEVWSGSNFAVSDILAMLIYDEITESIDNVVEVF